MNYLHTLVLIPILGFVSIGFAQEQEGIPPVEDIIEEEVFIDEFGTVDLIVNETEVSQVLEMLSIQSQKNIIASNNVTGVVSANLYDVTFNEALDAILRVNGCDLTVICMMSLRFMSRFRAAIPKINCDF